MCYFVEHNIQRKELEKRFNVSFPEDPRYTPAFFHSAFTKPYLPVITADKRGEVQLFRWGLIPFWTKDEASAEKSGYSTANARAETAWEKPSFRRAMQTGRCLISAHGFFEYHTTPELKIPYYIRLKNNEIFAFAGIYDTWNNPQTGEIIRTFSILTTSANPMMERIHNLKKRMPVILSKENEEMWIDPSMEKEKLNNVLVPFSQQQMEAYTVSRNILSKNINSNDPSIIEKFEYNQNPGLF
jgi:putative SOS response-associated peptidase YedK